MNKYLEQFFRIVFMLWMLAILILLKKVTEKEPIQLALLIENYEEVIQQRDLEIQRLEGWIDQNDKYLDERCVCKEWTPNTYGEILTPVQICN